MGEKSKELSEFEQDLHELLDSKDQFSIKLECASGIKKFEKVQSEVEAIGRQQGRSSLVNKRKSPAIS